MEGRGRPWKAVEGRGKGRGRPWGRPWKAVDGHARKAVEGRWKAGEGNGRPCHLSFHPLEAGRVFGEGEEILGDQGDRWRLGEEIGGDRTCSMQTE